MRQIPLAILSCLFFGPFTGMAQVSFGVQAGSMFTDMTFYQAGDDVQDFLLTTQGRFGWGAGIMLDIPVAGKFCLQPELAYRQKGFTEDPPPFSVVHDGNTYRWTHDHLDLSLLLRFHPQGISKGFHLLAGPSVGRLLGARVRNTDGPPFDPEYPTAWQTSPVGAVDPAWLGYSLFDVGINAGLGYRFITGTSRIALDLRYQHGLSNIHNGFRLLDVNGALIGEMNSRNTCVMLNVGWLLPVNGAAASAPDGK